MNQQSVTPALRGGLFAITLLLGGFCLAVGQESKGSSPQKPASLNVDKVISRYRSWTKVNPRPILMQPAAAAQCASASPAQQASPHLQKYITVYVNGAGKDALMHQKAARFPAGTVLVKEKLPEINSKSPELMTVMVKRDKGFNAEAGDWEYLVFDSGGKKVIAENKPERCQSCHNEYPARETDHVYRSYYLPAKLKAALK